MLFVEIVGDKQSLFIVLVFVVAMSCLCGPITVGSESSCTISKQTHTKLWCCSMVGYNGGE
jgi:hypothetical protein